MRRVFIVFKMRWCASSKLIMRRYC